MYWVTNRHAPGILTLLTSLQSPYDVFSLVAPWMEICNCLWPILTLARDSEKTWKCICNWRCEERNILAKTQSWSIRSYMIPLGAPQTLVLDCEDPDARHHMCAPRLQACFAVFCFSHAIVSLTASCTESNASSRIVHTALHRTHLRCVSW